VLLFGSFLSRSPLFSLPSRRRAIVALLIGGMQLTVPVSIGILMLMGIVTKNAIMLVDFAIESIHGGMARRRDHRRRPEAGAADRNDDGRDDRRHDPARSPWRRRRFRAPMAMR
jgi:hypothetical protein